jgi:hypothetical protein
MPLEEPETELWVATEIPLGFPLMKAKRAVRTCTGSRPDMSCRRENKRLPVGN